MRNIEEYPDGVFLQVQLHPSILPSDFDITPSGELVLNLPNNSSASTGNANLNSSNNNSSGGGDVPTATSTPTLAAANSTNAKASIDLMDNSGSLPRKHLDENQV